MAITAIARDWGFTPSIVRIECNDDLGVVLGSTYLADQATNIDALNKGAFEWKDGDLVLISYSGGYGVFARDFSTGALDLGGVDKITIVDLTAANITGMFAAPVQVLPAPGANLIYEVGFCQVQINHAAAFANGGAFGLQYGTTVNLGGPLATTTLAAAGMIVAADSVSRLAQGVALEMTAATSVNQSICISNDTAAFTGGVGSTVRLVIGHKVVPAIF